MQAERGHSINFGIFNPVTSPAWPEFRKTCQIAIAHRACFGSYAKPKNKPMLRRIAFSACFAVVSSAAATDWPGVRAILADTCHDCHHARKMKGGVDLARLAENPSVEAEYALWDKVREVIAKGEMPPVDETQPTAGEKQRLLAWVTGALDAVAAANAGDPGPVTLRRLTNAEYDRSVRDLTGVDYGLAKEFQPDAGGGEGFANTGDTLFVNPSQLDKYLAAARKLADHATILPGSGITFHPQRIGPRSPEQVKDQAQQALYVWYQKASEPHLPKDGDDFREADYLLACWQWKHKEQTGAASLDQLAKDASLVPAFLANWWKMLHDEKYQSRFLDLTRAPWRALPPPAADKPKQVPPAVLSTVRDIQAQRRSWLGAKDPGAGVQRRQQDSDGLRPYRLPDPFLQQNEDWGASGGLPGAGHVQVPGRVHLVLGDLGDGNRGDVVHFNDFTVRIGETKHPYLPFMREGLAKNRTTLAVIEAGQPAPEGVTSETLEKEIQEAEALLARFGKTLDGQPADENTLILQAPAIVPFPLPAGASSFTGTGRLDLSHPDADHATVQWALTLNTPPDPQSILPGVLTVWKRSTEASGRVMGDFNRMKMVFPDVLERRLEQVAGNLHRGGSPGPGVYYFSDEQLLALLDDKEKKHFQQMREDWGFVAPAKLNEPQSQAYDERLLGHLHHFASLAWRRPLSGQERGQINGLYQQSRAKEMDRESAARECLAFILVSPKFLYQSEIGTLAGAAEDTETPLDAWELAARLSYFLWSSLPDESLRQAAADGSLLTPEGRAVQVRRMLRDRKADALALEFAGQWLEFKGFEHHSAVDDQKFPEFTPDLRRDMNRETTLFFTHLIREDRPVREILSADYTFLNERLARHYGVPDVAGEQLVKVSVSGKQRGGLLGQGSLLTKTSRSHRTSPVLRGNWLLQAVLGTPVPPPPSDVPELQEHGPKPASVREMLEQHRASKACSGCHDRIDPLGFALENFDAIGRWRERDEAGLPLDTSAQVKGGASFTGFEGLRGYLQTQQPQFARHFSRKLLGYALGRQVLPTDKALLQEMQAAVTEGEGRFSSAILRVVESRQFLNKRL